MNVVLDTNIYVQDFLMNSTSFSLLFDYLKKTNSRILMPLIVYQELGAIYRSSLSARLAEHERARRSLENLLVDAQIPYCETDISSEVEKYFEFVKKKLNIRDNDIVPYREGYLGELVTRAVARLKPFSDRGEEFRDTLLWLTVLDIAREAKGETLAFISNDTRAFGQNHRLYEVLLRETKATGRQVNYYNSISRFIESHATQVDYVTRSWLHSAINFRAFEDVVIEKLRKYLERLDGYGLSQRGWEGLEFSGYLSPTGHVTEENLTEHYVYEKSDESLYIQANYYIEYEVEFTSRGRFREGGFLQYSWQIYDYNLNEDSEYEIERKTVYKYPEAEIIFGVTVRDRQVAGVELSSWHL